MENHPNFKNKELTAMYNPISSEEIALRCTIIDLVEKLKRTQFLCNYYEQCRNELVADCIRLKRERDFYLMAHRNQLQKSDSVNKPKIDQFPVHNTNIPKGHPNFQFEEDVNIEVEENYEEIAKRLIERFREEMEELRRASSTDGNESGNNQNAEHAKSNLVPNNVESDSTYSKIHASPPKDGTTLARKTDNKLDPQNEKVTFSAMKDAAATFTRSKGTTISSSPEKSVGLKKSIVTINGSSKEPVVEDKDVPTIIEVNPSKSSGLNPSEGILSSSSSNETNQYIQFVNRIIQTTINDYDELAKRLANQNETLRRLKGKQLRSYFKRQLDPNTDNTSPRKV